MKDKSRNTSKDVPIFYGDYSRDMWDAINDAKTKDDLRSALYFVCCRIQELEGRMRRAPQRQRRTVRRDVV